MDSILSSLRLLLEGSRERALGWVQGARSQASGPAAAQDQVGRDLGGSSLTVKGKTRKCKTQSSR